MRFQWNTIIVLRPEMIFPSGMTVLAWPCRDKKTFLPNVEKELMTEVWHLLKNKEECGLPPPLSSDYKTVAH